jgi:hypothetical protein
VAADQEPPGPHEEAAVLVSSGVLRKSDFSARQGKGAVAVIARAITAGGRCADKQGQGMALPTNPPEPLAWLGMDG